MAEREKKPTLTEYREIGERMKTIHDELGKLYVLISNTSGKTKRETRKILNIKKELGVIRAELEDKMFEQYPIKPHTPDCEETLNYFYGGRRQ